MLLLRLLSVFLLALVTAWGCAGAPNQEPPPELLTAIDSFYASVESGNGEARIALFSDSAIMMPNHWTLTRGKDGIARIIRSSEGSVFRLKDREVVDMDVDGSIAYVTNSYFYTWHAEGGDFFRRYPCLPVMVGNQRITKNEDVDHGTFPGSGPLW